jgi:hypothetical protein
VGKWAGGNEKAGRIDFCLSLKGYHYTIRKASEKIFANWSIFENEAMVSLYASKAELFNPNNGNYSTILWNHWKNVPYGV